MSKEKLRDQPISIKLAVFLAFFNSWVLFEELVIDRHGLHQYLPFYRVGLFCVWDVLALAVIGAVVFLRLFKEKAPTPNDNRRVRRCLRWCPLC